MSDPILEPRPAGTARTRGHVMTARRAAALIALLVLALSLRRHVRFVRDLVRHRRRLRLAFTLLVLLRQLRKS